MRSLPIRILVFGGLTCATAPAAVLPDVGDNASHEVAAPGATTTTETPAPSATLVPITSEPDHLVVAEAAPDPEPEAVVTTTSASPTTTVPPTTTTAAPAVTVAFSATQAYGSCDEPIPYDIFSGTATPGTSVAISSPYGSGSATADGNGHWEKKVEFAGAPKGETFAVTASGLGAARRCTSPPGAVPTTEPGGQSGESAESAASARSIPMTVDSSAE